MKMKKFLILSTLVAMSIGCVGCGGNAATNNATTNNATTNATTGATTNNVDGTTNNVTTNESSTVNTGAGYIASPNDDTMAGVVNESLNNAIISEQGQA